MNEFSMNARMILEPYVSDHQIKATQGAGLALIQQKVGLVGLKLKIDYRLTTQRSVSVDGTSSSGPEILCRGSVAWIKEELLYTQPWAKSLYSCSAIEGKFIIVDQQYVEFVTPA